CMDSALPDAECVDYSLQFCQSKRTCHHLCETDHHVDRDDDFTYPGQQWNRRVLLCTVFRRISLGLYLCDEHRVAHVFLLPLSVVRSRVPTPLDQTGIVAQEEKEGY